MSTNTKNVEYKNISNLMSPQRFHALQFSFLEEGIGMGLTMEQALVYADNKMQALERALF